MSTKPQWRKSSYSGQGNACVEVADARLVRDSKLGDESPILSLSEAAFKAFIDATKRGKFN